MRLAEKVDIEAPIDTVFAQLIDAELHMHNALRRGVKLRRSGEGRWVSVGETWACSFTYRRKKRQVEATITRIDPGHLIAVDGRSGALDVATEIELVALSRQRTRMAVALELKPRSLSTRLMVQSLRLTRSTVERRMARRMGDLAQTMAARASAP